jgi:hypothetical protein
MIYRLVREGVSFPITRRQFLKAGTATTLALLTTNFGSAIPHLVSAAGNKNVAAADPRPIPYGLPFLYPDPTIFHVQAPGYPLPNPPFDSNPASNNPATITDFNGFVGLGYVGGYGTHHNLTTNVTKKMYWEVDMRFMVGEYVGVDGLMHNGTIGFA